MGEKDVGVEDIFENWADIEATFGAASNVLVEEEFDTGLALFGDRAWAIHRMEIYGVGFPLARAIAIATADDQIRMMVAVGRPGLTPDEAKPKPDEGLILKSMHCAGFHFSTQGVGAVLVQEPWVWRPSTPVPYARNKLSVYVACENDEAAFQNAVIAVRIAYTYIPATKELYRELQERWSL